MFYDNLTKIDLGSNGPNYEPVKYVMWRMKNRSIHSGFIIGISNDQKEKDRLLLFGNSYFKVQVNDEMLTEPKIKFEEKWVTSRNGEPIYVKNIISCIFEISLDEIDSEKNNLDEIVSEKASHLLELNINQDKYPSKINEI